MCTNAWKTWSGILIDDEFYVKIDFEQLPSQNFANKFVKKVMNWQGIYSCGLKAQSFITTSRMKVEGLQSLQGLQKRGLPFFRLCWWSINSKVCPDLTCSISVPEWYAPKVVDFMSKQLENHYCPEFRPIEKFWATAFEKKAFKVEEIRWFQLCRLWWARSKIKFAISFEPVKCNFLSLYNWNMICSMV